MSDNESDVEDIADESTLDQQSLNNNNSDSNVIKIEQNEESAMDQPHQTEEDHKWNIIYIMELPENVSTLDEINNDQKQYYTPFKISSLEPMKSDEIWWIFRKKFREISQFKMHYYHGLTLDDNNYDNSGLKEMKIKMENNENSSNNNDQLMDSNNNNNDRSNNNNNENENENENDDVKYQTEYWMRFDAYYSNGFYDRYPIFDQDIQPQTIKVYVTEMKILNSQVAINKQFNLDCKQWIKSLSESAPYDVAPWYNDNVDCTLKRILARHGFTGMLCCVN